MRCVNFIMVLRSGGCFEKKHVLELARSIDVHSCGREHSNICLTDTVKRRCFQNGVIWIPLKRNWPGWWSKLEMFDRRLYSSLPALYLDLDTLVVGSLRWLWDLEENKFAALRDFHHPERSFASGVMFLPKRVFLPVIRGFASDPAANMRRFRGDQDYLATILEPQILLQDAAPGKVLTYKPTRDTVLETLPAGASIVCFHGSPRPWEAIARTDWIAKHYTGMASADFKPGSYPYKHSGTAIVCGSAEGMLEEYERVMATRPGAYVFTVGHAAGMVKADFVTSDHYEVHAKLRKLQLAFHDQFTTHCTRCSQWQSIEAVDYWWNWIRSEATSAQTAIRIALAMGFDEVILCGCPLRRGKVQHPDQIVKDGSEWPPPNRRTDQGSDDVLVQFRINFARFCNVWQGRVFSMSGFTQDCLGAPDLNTVRATERSGIVELAPSSKEVEPAVSLLCPTRGRPDLAMRMAESALETAQASVELLFWIDDDDTSDYSALDTLPRCRVLRGTVESVGEAWNRLAAVSRGKLLMMANDDLVYRTNGWDLCMLRASAGYPDGIFVMWCDDGTGKAMQRCAFPVVSRKWYELLGYFTPTCFYFLWHDTWVHDVGRRLRREVYLQDVLVEHCHFSMHKAEMDGTYLRHREGEVNRIRRRLDAETFENTSNARQKDADFLGAYKSPDSKSQVQEQQVPDKPDPSHTEQAEKASEDVQQHQKDGFLSPAECLDFWTGASGLKHQYPPDQRWPDRDVSSILNELLVGRICEVGCGIGRIASIIHPVRYIGVDISRKAIRQARCACPAHSFKVIGMDGLLPAADTYLFYTVLLHVPDSELPKVPTRVLASSGARSKVRVVVFESMARSRRTPSSPHAFSRDPDEYIGTFGASGFSVVEHRHLPSAVRPGFRDFLVLEWQQKESGA